MTALRLQIGARTLAVIPRDLVRVGLSLEQAMAGAAPVLPPVGRADGYLVTSLSERAPLGGDGLRFARQHYTRYYVDLAAGEAAWRTQLSGQTRSTLKRKVRRWGEAHGGIDVRRYRTPDDLAAFHVPARAVSATTYQERLMAAGLPDDPAIGVALAQADRVRAWLLFAGDVPAAYLWCSADGNTLRYDHVGHDPAFAALSPGTVLMNAALADLFADRFRWFDFTEGEGQHKSSLASGGVACADWLLLRPTLANRAVLAGVGGFDAAMRLAKRASRASALQGVAIRIRRAG